MIEKLQFFKVAKLFFVSFPALETRQQSIIDEQGINVGGDSGGTDPMGDLDMAALLALMGR